MNEPALPATLNRRRPNPRPRRSRALLMAGVLAAVLAVAGCSNSGTDSSSATSDQQYASEAPETGEGAGAGEAADSAAGSRADDSPGEQDGKAEQGDSPRQKPPKIASHDVVRKARLTVRVKDVPSALDDTRSTVETAGGYVADETTDRDDQGHERSHLVLRVPQEKYADDLEKLAGSGKLIERKVRPTTSPTRWWTSRAGSPRRSQASIGCET